MSIVKAALLTSTLAGGLLLCACTTPSAHMGPNFGAAERQDMAAQIADPDAKYAGKPDPGSNGQRSALALSRYARDRVTAPVAQTTSSVAGSAGAGGGGDSGGPSGPQ
jgi:hypothetical protein